MEEDCEKVKKYIKKYGIPEYVNKTKFENKKLEEVLMSYHWHCSLIDSNSFKAINKWPVEFSGDTVRFKLYYGEYDPDYVENYGKLMDEHIRRYPDKIVLDFSHHMGGNIKPHIMILESILGATTLLAFAPTEASMEDKSWLNLRNSKITQGTFMTAKLKYSGQIIVRISPNTIGGGEVLAAIFCGREKIKFRGEGDFRANGY